jgi:hypothetical protein
LHFDTFDLPVVDLRGSARLVRQPLEIEEWIDPETRTNAGTGLGFGSNTSSGDEA